MKSRTFHVLALAHQPVTDKIPSCAFTAKVYGMCQMLMRAGHTVILYGAGPYTTAPVTEYVSCVSEQTLIKNFGPNYDSQLNRAVAPSAVWREFESSVARAIGRRLSDKTDLVLCSYGSMHQQCCPSDKVAIPIEMSVSYGGIFAAHKIFESYAKQHALYQSELWTEPYRQCDVVIPPPLPTSLKRMEVPERKHALFLGCIWSKKGVEEAYWVAQQAGLKLIIAGPGQPEWIAQRCPEALYLGMVDDPKRSELLSSAKVVLCLSRCIEPYGPVAMEAAYCGAPVIASDWGGYTETVIDGQTGFRVRTLNEAVRAIEHLGKIKSETCQEWSNRFTQQALWPRYERYFERVLQEHEQTH